MVVTSVFRISFGIAFSQVVVQMGCT